MLDRGVTEEVLSGEYVSEYYYMPHQSMLWETSVNTKIRPVFDASAYNGLSLNDCFENGPNLLPDLVQILLRFRHWLAADTGDIRNEFHQIKAKQKPDRYVHCLLW